MRQREADLGGPDRGHETPETGNRHVAGNWFRGPRRRGAHHPGSERPWVNRTVAISQHVPPSRYPGSTTVIPPATAADLPNQQGPCLRNSSGCTPRPPHKRLFPAVTPVRENETFAPILGSNDRRQVAHPSRERRRQPRDGVLRQVTESVNVLPPPSRAATTTMLTWGVILRSEHAGGGIVRHRPHWPLRRPAPGGPTAARGPQRCDIADGPDRHDVHWVWLFQVSFRGGLSCGEPERAEGWYLLRWLRWCSWPMWWSQ